MKGLRPFKHPLVNHSETPWFILSLPSPETSQTASTLIDSSLYTRLPPYIVAITLPLSVEPARGVFLPLEAKAVVSTNHSLSGSKMITSAGAPILSVPSLPYLSPISLAGSPVSLEALKTWLEELADETYEPLLAWVNDAAESAEERAKNLPTGTTDGSG